MIVIASGRKTSRTTQLINLCAEAEARGEISYIVVKNHERAQAVAQKARELGLTMGFPVTFNEFLSNRWSANNIKNFFIDDADQLLASLAAPAQIAAIVVLKENLEDDL